MLDLRRARMNEVQLKYCFWCICIKKYNESMINGKSLLQIKKRNDTKVSELKCLVIEPAETSCFFAENSGH